MEHQLSFVLKPAPATPVQVRNFEAALKSFVEGCRRIHEEHRREQFPHTQPAIFSIDRGSRYARVVRACPSRMAHCFVDTQTGIVYKAESWDRHGAHGRGNIYDRDNGLAQMRAYGPATAGARPNFRSKRRRY